MSDSDENTDSTVSTKQSAGVFRRIAAIAYDALLMIAIAFVVTNLYLIIYHLFVGLGPEPLNPLLLNTTLFPLLLATNCGFLLWFWLNGGRTLGMRAWHLKIVSESDQAITVKQALLRLCFAPLSFLPFGLGFWFCWIDPQGLSWHDRLSKTRLVLDRKKR